MSDKNYSVKEVFATLQGEGFHAGTPAVFVRFAGCNMWSGHDEHRERDAARHGAECPLWCDTDFRFGAPMSSTLIAADVLAAAKGAWIDRLPLIVLSGGEPLLQVTDELVDELRGVAPHATIAVETNGTVLPKTSKLDWICVSPKVAVSKLKLVRGNELKVVYPAYDPAAYSSIADNFTHCFVQPEASTERVGVSLLENDNMRRAVKWVMVNPGWRLSVQTHKILHIP